jgi:glycosyltransferase involved in cell wall biosynthesis
MWRLRKGSSPSTKPRKFPEGSENPLAKTLTDDLLELLMHPPVVASYCNTFLKREMQHIYRQVTGLREFQTFIMTKSRENADAFPFPNIEVLPRPRINFLLRFQRKYLQRMEPVFYRGEYDQLEAVLTRRNAQLLHVYFGHTGVHLLPFMRNWSRPSLVSFHGMDIMLRNEEPGYNHRLRTLLTTLPLVLARSESLASRLVELGCDASKIRINRTGVPMDGFPYLVHSPPADGAWCIIQASRFIEKKGLDITLRAFAEFREKYPNAKLVLAGEGPLEGQLKDLARTLGVGGSVRFPGFLNQQQLAAAYASAHLFLHPSQTTMAGDQEGVPNSMLEAMASGLPVVATLHGGIPEAVHSGFDGLLVPERDGPALVNGLLEIAEDSTTYETFSRNAAQSVRENFEQGRSIARLERIYRELIN